MLCEILQIALEGCFSNACYDSAKSTLFKIIDQDKYNKFCKELKKAENDFKVKHDGTIVTTGIFYNYIQKNKVFEQMIEYVLSKDIMETENLLDENSFIKHQISCLYSYFKDEKEILRPADKNIINNFYNLIYNKIKSFLLNGLINSQNIKNDFINKQKISYLKTIIDILKQTNNNDDYDVKNRYNLLLKQLSISFEEEKKNNPSFALIEFDQTILPYNNLINYNIVTLDDFKKTAVFSEFLFLSKAEEKAHIFLYGMGGIGKTVTLLSTNYSNPVIYIPLRNISKSENCISNYIKEQTLHSDENFYETLIQYCELYWNSKTNLILIIDGLNEVDHSLRRLVLQEIENVWSKKRNIQLIMTSRNDLSSDLDYMPLWVLKTNLLSKEIINNFLISNHITPPSPSSVLWSIIDTPLMLILYVKSNYLKNRVRNSEIILRRNINAGSIIWNFLQSEIYRLKISKYSNYFTGIVAAVFIAPYIAYKMQEKGTYFIDSKTFDQYKTQGYDLYVKYDKLDLLPKYLNSLKEEAEGGEIINKSQLNYILTKKLCLFHKTEDRIQLIHQHFRDCFAAIHMTQISETCNNVPVEWKKAISPNVTEFMADLISTEDVFDFEINTWERIWNYDYKNHNPSPYFIPQMLQLYKLCFGSDLSKVDLSNLDLSDVSLSGYKFSHESKKHFVNTKLTNNTFIGNGHRKSITSISWSPSNKNFLSASHDCTVRMWDNVTKQGTTLRDINNYHKHYIRCGQWNPTDENTFVTSGDDKHIVIWKKPDENIGWITKSAGKCTDWVVGITWSNDGNNILSGERNGNIELFDENGKIRKYNKIHNDYVRRIAWAKDNKLFVTGSDDGLICIWNKNKNKPIKILKLRESELQSITSIKWLCDDKILAISDESTLYCLDTEKIFALDDQEILCENKDFVLKTKSSTKISFVAINSKSSYDYFSIFHENGIDIFRGYTTTQNTYEFSTIATKSINSQNFNKIICAEWNNECNRIMCGSRAGDLCEIKVDVSEEYVDRISLYTIGYKNNNTARCTAWSHNNKFIAAGYDDCRVRIWDLESKKCINVLSGHKDSVKCVVWSPDDDFIASGSDDCTVLIWNPPTQEPYKKSTHHSAPVNNLLWLNSGHIISASDDKTIVKFNAVTKEKSPPLKKHTKRVYCLASSHDEKYIISVGNDKLLCLWNIKTCKCIQCIKSEHTEPIRSVAWSSDGIIVTGSNDCSWMIRKTTDSNHLISKEYQKKDHAHEDFIYSVAISNDNKIVITGSTDYTVGFWNIENQELICYGKEHDFFIWSVSSNNNINGDSYVATASSDGTVKIWNTANLKNKEIHPETSLEAIANIDIVGCDFSEAIFDTEELKKLIETNGGLI